MSSTKRKILIAAGGTGGHIYPALAVAEAFTRKFPGTEIAFVGTAHGLENKIIKNYPLYHLPIGRLNSNVAMSERLMTVLKLPWALVKSWMVLRRFRPDLVLGVGGHASGPLLLMASLTGWRSAIWEPNAMPGMANRILSRVVGDAWVVFEEAKPHLHSRRLHRAGMPVRREIESSQSKRAPSGEFHILVFGGSQGARTLNDRVVELVRENRDWIGAGIKIVHQTGAADFERIRQAYGDALNSGRVELRDYLHDMEERYAWADLVIARSGTGTLSELAACGKPAVLVPLPTAADDHQRKNAESLAGRGAAVMILQKDLNVDRLKNEIDNLRRDPGSLAEMAVKIREFHQPQAADRLVEEFCERMADASR